MDRKELLEESLRESLEELKNKRMERRLADTTKDINQGFSRPILKVLDNMFVYKNLEKNSMVKNMLPYKEKIKAAIAASGILIIDSPLIPTDKYPGTAFLVEKNIIVTNRHVAETFAKKSGGKFIFKKDNHGREMSVKIDFKKEYRNTDKIQFDIVKVLYIEESNGPDIAFLKINIVGDKIPSPVNLSTVSIKPNDYVCTIGYPQEDKNYPDQGIMKEMLEDIYGVKRVSPGMVKSVKSDIFFHDCSTIGGNSGSMIFDYKKGEAIGIHFRWSDFTSNDAVTSDVILKKLNEIKNG